MYKRQREVRGPLSYGVLIALLAVVPIAVMEGRPGAFLEPFALAFALAVLAAMVVAVTVTPALALLLFSRDSPGHRESPLVSRLRPRYDSALGRFTKRSRTPLLAAAACILVGAAALPLLSTSPVPTFKDDNVLVRLDGEAGTSNTKMTGIATAVSRQLRSLPGVDNVGAHVGRAVTGDQRVDVNSAEVWASIAAGADHDEMVRRIEDAVGRVPGVDREVAGYTTGRMRAVGALGQGDNDVEGDGLDVLTGADAPLVTRVYGHDLGVLRSQAEKVRRLMSGVDGVVDARVERPGEQPNLVIEVDLARAQRHGITPGDVRRAEATLLHGIHVGSVFDQQKVFDVLVTGVPRTRQGVEDVRDLLIDRPGGGHVRLGQVADVRIEPTPVAIEREAVSRYLDVEAGVSGRSLGAVAGDVRTRLAATSFPLEYHAEVMELTTGEEIGLVTVLAFALVAVAAAFLLLQAAFGSWRLAGLAFLLVPAALVGGVLAVLVAGAELSLGSMTGFLALLALAVRTTVLSVRHLEQMEHRHNGDFGPTVVRQGAQERLAPILTTATAVALLALPFVLLGTRPGLEIVHPMAVVLVGGILSATLVSLFALPGLYVRHGAGGSPPAEWDDARVMQLFGGEPDAAPGVVAGPRPGDGKKIVAMDGPAPEAMDGPAPDLPSRETER